MTRGARIVLTITEKLEILEFRRKNPRELTRESDNNIAMIFAEKYGKKINRMQISLGCVFTHIKLQNKCIFLEGHLAYTYVTHM